MGKLKKSTKKFVSQKKKVAKGGNAPEKKRKKYVKTPTEELPGMHLLGVIAFGTLWHHVV